jgi:hypothetical protein
LKDPTSSFVERFLLKDLRIIPATLSCKRSEAEKRIIEAARISIANSFSIFKISFML